MAQGSQIRSATAAAAAVAGRSGARIAQQRQQQGSPGSMQSSTGTISSGSRATCEGAGSSSACRFSSTRSGKGLLWSHLLLPVASDTPASSKIHPPTPATHHHHHHPLRNTCVSPPSQQSSHTHLVTRFCPLFGPVNLSTPQV